MQLTFAQDWIERLFGHAEETPELATPVIAVGDKFDWGTYEVEVVSIQTGCPYLTLPVEWEVWGADGDWAYVEARDYSTPAHLALSNRRAEYVPVDFLVMLALEG